MMFEPDMVFKDEDPGFFPSSSFVSSSKIQDKFKGLDGNEVLIKILSDMKPSHTKTFENICELWYSKICIEYYIGKMNSFRDYSSFANGGIILNPYSDQEYRWRSNRCSVSKETKFGLSQEAKTLLWKNHLVYVQKWKYNPVPEYTDILMGACEQCGTDVYVPIQDDMFEETQCVCTGCEAKGKIVIFLPKGQVRLKND